MLLLLLQRWVLLLFMAWLLLPAPTWHTAPCAAAFVLPDMHESSTCWSQPATDSTHSLSANRKTVKMTTCLN
jgi:hypothetical protein